MKWKPIIEAKAPGLIEIIYPRLYERLSGYTDLEEISYQLCVPIFLTSIVTQGGPPIDQNIFNAYSTVAKLAQENMPTFFVTKELYHELLAAEFPPETKLEEITWPFDGLLLVLPEGLLNAPEEGNCPFLAVARFGNDDTISIPNTSAPEFKMTLPSFQTIACPLTSDGEPALISSRVVFETHPTLGHIMKGPLGEFQYGGLATPGSPRTEQEFTDFIAEFTIKLLLYLANHPSKMTMGVVVRAPKLNHKKFRREIRKPNIIG